MNAAFAPGKIILSGEYAMLFGHPGLGIPSSIGLSAIFSPDAAMDGITVDWTGVEPAWKNYIASIIAACAKRQGDLFRGRLRLENHLPLGKGMGSSTAAVVAICIALLGDDEEAALAVENAVNPGNSGMDFALIWKNRPLRFVRGGETEEVTLDPGLLQNPVLIDSGAPGETTMELVAWVREREEEMEGVLETIGTCADRLLDGESPLFVFPDHHRAQVALGVVPEGTQELIAHIEALGGAAKVIGAGARTGGGGMILAVHPDPKAIEAIPGGWPVTRL